MMTIEESLAAAQAVIAKILADGHDRISLVTQIAIEVGADIVEEIIPPGHDLNSVDLARRYNTSRTPIREALLLLEKEGLVEIPPRRRPRAKLLDIQTVREIYRTRAALLEFIAADVALVASEDDLEAIRAQLATMDEAVREGDVRAYVWAIIAFYDLNCRASGNGTATRIIKSLLLRTISLRRWSFSQPGRMAESIEDHRRVFKAYQDRDAHLAAAIVRSNNISALRRIEMKYQALATFGTLKLMPAA